jgi:hypothetical protein
VPVVDVVGVVTMRSDEHGDRLEAVLITEHLQFSVPYRLLFLRQEHTRLREPMLDALVHLLVRIHINGFLWGDCSLSNTLFRRDAGRLAAYVVDTETGELYDELSRGQRQMDVELAIEKCAGELFDLQAAGVLSIDVDPMELGLELEERYHTLWSELTRDELFTADERHRIYDRLGRINDLGYDVEEVELVQDTQQPGLTRMKLRTSVLEPGRHRRLLKDLTGIEAQENQARRLLNDLHSYGAWLQQEEGRTLTESIIAHRWFEAIFEPIVALVPEDLRGRRDQAEIFHEVLDHWHHLSELKGADAGLWDAARSYVDTVLRFEPEERLVAPAEGDDDIEGFVPDPLADTGSLALEAVRAEIAEAEQASTDR